MGSDIDTCLYRLNEVEQDYALEIYVFSENFKAGVLLLPDLFQVCIYSLNFSEDEGLIDQLFSP